MKISAHVTSSCGVNTTSCLRCYQTTSERLKVQQLQLTHYDYTQPDISQLSNLSSCNSLPFIPSLLVFFFAVGAHLNPAVTLSFCVLGQVPWTRLVPYSLSQVFGAYVASGIVYLVYYGLLSPIFYIIDVQMVICKIKHPWMMKTRSPLSHLNTYR